MKKRIDYQELLRDIATSMVRLKHPERLLKIITKLIDRQLGLTHTSILVFEEHRDHFTFADSKGSRRLPLGLIRVDSDHAFVRFFQTPKFRALPGKGQFLSRPVLKKWQSLGAPPASGPLAAEEAERLLKAMDIMNVELAVPGYYKKKLLGLLLLGRKKDGRPFTASEISFFHILLQDCSMAVKTAEYHRHLAGRNQELGHRLQEIEKLRKKENETYYEIMKCLAQEVHAKDAYTFGHISQVERLGLMTAKEMGLDLSGRKKDALSAGLLLHDLGKIGIPDDILKKPAPLNGEEWKVMVTHVEKGAKILEHITDFKEVAKIVWCHHENFDGSGYPRGLKASEIPVESRIISVVDAFHAIVSTRCYRPGRPVEVALSELERCAGTQFDPQVVEAFARALKREMKKRGVGFFLEEALEQNPGPFAA